MQENVRKEIDGSPYVFGYLLTSKAVLLVGRLTKLVAPSFGEMISTPTGSVADMDATKVLQLFADRLNPEEVLGMAKELCSVVMREASDGNGGLLVVDFENDFRGRPGHMFKVAAQSLEVNAGDFFGAIKEKIASARATTTTRERQASTGPSGA
jgi:hypothetical protein